MRKQFSQKLHDENDKIGRRAVKDLYKALGYSVADNSDIYGIDLFIKKDNRIIAVEVDHKAGWIEPYFVFQSVIVTDRKTKFLEAGCLHAVVNKPCEIILVARSEMILLSQKKENRNKYVPKGEMVYYVPIDKWTEYKKGKDY